MNERLKSLRKILGLNQKEMGDRMRLSQTHISSLENGAREVTDRILSDICREFNVNEVWLRTGEGEVFLEEETFSLDEKAKKYNLSDLEIDIMRGYMELPSETRNELMGLFSGIFSKHTETAATTVEDEIEAELESYRKELEAEKKVRTSSASQGQRKGLIG